MTEPRLNYLKNWISFCGILLSVCSFVSGITLLAVDFANPGSSPYIGILLFLVVPAVLCAGLSLVLAGVLRHRHRLRKSGAAALPRMPVIDLNNHRHTLVLFAVAGVTLLFLVISGVGGYRAYHYTESVAFCGTACHAVMKPEYTAYGNSPHAHVDCVKCHIGPGTGAFVQAKLNGLRQVKSVVTGNFEKPIPGMAHRMRPARETCLACHWPNHQYGSVERRRTYFKPDEENSAYAIRMLLHVGGGDPDSRKARGIHYHMGPANRIEFIATDSQLQEIPWVRHTDRDGKVSIYQTTDPESALSKAQVAAAAVRDMDCLDCHNRPAHRYLSPNASLDSAMTAGIIDTRKLADFKYTAAELLLGEYASQDDGLRAIEKGLRDTYESVGPELDRAVKEVKRIYATSFFPEMKVNWRAYPDNSNHFISKGCFRCHDDQHTNESGKTISKDCRLCHSIIAQGPAPLPDLLTSGGVAFIHPEEIEGWKATSCSECHTGAPDI